MQYRNTEHMYHAGSHTRSSEDQPELIYSVSGTWGRGELKHRETLVSGKKNGLLRDISQCCSLVNNSQLLGNGFVCFFAFAVNKYSLTQFINDKDYTFN